MEKIIIEPGSEENRRIVLESCDLYSSILSQQSEALLKIFDKVFEGAGIEQEKHALAKIIQNLNFDKPEFKLRSESLSLLTTEIARRLRASQAVALDVDESLLVVDALDFYSRIHMGQLEEIERILRLSMVNLEQCDLLLVETLKIKRLLDIPVNGHFGVLGHKMHSDGLLAFKIMQLIRYEASWAKIGKNPRVDKRTIDMMGVNYDEPLFSDDINFLVSVKPTSQL